MSWDRGLGPRAGTTGWDHGLRGARRAPGATCVRVCRAARRGAGRGKEVEGALKKVIGDHTGLNSSEISIFNLTASSARICRAPAHFDARAQVGPDSKSGD
jgi:hypothetical protein